MGAKTLYKETVLFHSDCPAVPAASPIDLAASPDWKDVWRGGDCVQQEAVLPTGHAALDAELPGGGWPVGSLIELLLERPERHLWQLLLPVLVHTLSVQPGPVVLVGAPYLPFLPSLAAQGLPAARLLRIDAAKPQARLWAAEQALRCAEVAAVVAWPGQVQATDLRRLHMAAQQHDRMLFACRTPECERQSSPARLRLHVAGAESLQVRILKRRGPPLVQPLTLAAHPARLAALLDARKARRSSLVLDLSQPRSRSHVVDRTAALA